MKCIENNYRKKSESTKNTTKLKANHLKMEDNKQAQTV